MKTTLLSLLALSGLAVGAPTASAMSAATAVDVANSVVAAGGYDVVSYRTSEKPVRGNGNHVVLHDGATFLFQNDENAKAFRKNPARYAPAFGGYCAYGAAVGKKFVGDPDVWAIVDDRLYLNLDTKIQGIWSKDVAGNIEKAEANWARIRSVPAADL